MVQMLQDHEASAPWPNSIAERDVLQHHGDYYFFYTTKKVNWSVAKEQYLEQLENDYSRWHYNSLLPASTRPHRHKAAIEARVTRVRELTARSGNAFNNESAAKLLVFCQRLKPDLMPSIFAVVSGNLRTIWRNSQEEQIGIQYIPDGKLQYVLFRHEAGISVETMGFELSFEKLHSLVSQVGLTRLWFYGER